METKPRVSYGEIRFYINTGAKIEEYFQAISNIIDCFGGGRLIDKWTSPEDSSGYRYMLGTSNNWWASHGDTANEVVVACRYNGNVEFMSKLRDVLIRLLKIEEFNK